MSAAIFIKRIISWKKNCFGQKHHGACRARKSRYGEAMISLSPLVQMNAAAPPRAAPPTPNPEMVATWEIHSSRRPITRDTMTQAMVTVQKQLRLPTGLRTGLWSEEANERLRSLLARPKRGFTPPKEDEVPPKKKQQLAITDKPHEESDALQGQPH